MSFKGHTVWCCLNNGALWFSCWCRPSCSIVIISSAWQVCRGVSFALYPRPRTSASHQSRCCQVLAAVSIKRKGFFEFTVMCPEKTTKGFQLIKLFNYLFHIVSRLFFSQPLRDLILLNTSEMVLQTKLFTLSIYMLQFLWKVHLKLCC